MTIDEHLKNNNCLNVLIEQSNFFFYKCWQKNEHID